MSTNLNPSGNKLNQLSKKTKTHHSRFQLRPDIALTARFGDVTPFLVQNTIPGDKISTRSNISLRTYTLKSPLMQDIKMQREYFNVPLRAILPFNWDKIYVNPNIGDDVPSGTNSAYCSLSRFDFIRRFSLTNFLSAHSSFGSAELCPALHWYNIVEQVFTSGGLCNILGLAVPSLDSYFNTLGKSFADVVNICILRNTAVAQFSILNGDGEPIDHIDLSSVPAHSWYSYFSDYTLSPFEEESPDNAWVSKVSFAALRSICVELNNEITRLINEASPEVNGQKQYDSSPIDLSRLWAYQMVYHHFYTNDKVDFIYSAEQFRNYIGGLVISSIGVDTFPYNGSNITYDFLSGNYTFGLGFNNFLNNVIACISYNNALFTFRRSLRYMDYFTSSRTRPLAIGNTGVSVNSNSVDVVDITRSIQVQKFLNQVNRTGRKFSKYISDIFGAHPGYDYHDPKFLAGTEDVVYGSETENTSFSGNSESNNVRTNLFCKSNKFAFEFEVQEPSIILGLLTFDIVRYYTDSADRQTMVKDRFDMFNPYLQYIGDQATYLAEFNKSLPMGLKPFGYATRYMEYKQAVPRAVGGFVDNLPSWLFDSRGDLVNSMDNRRFINYDLIRSTSYELDKFYLSLTGKNLNSYFHFIIKCDNYFDAVRDMAVDPQILG